MVDLDMHNLVVVGCRLARVWTGLGYCRMWGSTKYEVLGASCGGLTVGRVCVNVGPTDTGLNLGAGP